MTSAAVALSAIAAMAAARVIALKVVVGGYILAATIVDYVDNKFEVKETVAKAAR